MPISKSGFLVEDEKPQSITTQSLELGTGTPSSPLGGVVAGATPKQADMIGTPAQTKSAQTARSAAEAAPLQTLSETERYSQKPQPVPTQYEEAKDKAKTLATLGPVQTRVQALIEQRIDEVTQHTATIQANQDQIDLLPVEQRAPALAALNAYIANPTEENLKPFYDVIGSAALDASGITNYIEPISTTLTEEAQQQLDRDVIIADLDLTALGVDPDEIAKALGISTVELQGMSLDQLNQAIDVVEAQELNQTEQIRAQLADPTLTPARRQELYKELAQLGAAGVVGLEDDINRLDDQINAAQTVSFMGKDYELRELLGDDGISAEIAKAVADPDYLDKLGADPLTKGLAAWIKSNKAALEGLVGDIDISTQTFTSVQDDRDTLVRSLGEDGVHLINALVPGQDFSASMTADEFSRLRTKLEKDPVYQVLLADPMLAAQAKADPAVFKNLQALAAQGLNNVAIRNALKAQQEWTTNSEVMQALGIKYMPTTSKEIRDSMDAMNRYEALGEDIRFLGESLLKEGEVTLGDLEYISHQPHPTEILKNIQSNKTYRESWDKEIDLAEAPLETIMTKVFGTSDISYLDLEYAMKYGDTPASAMIADIFDENKDGFISPWEVDESNTEDIRKRAEAVLGINSNDLSTTADLTRNLDKLLKSAPANIIKNVLVPKLTAKLEEQKAPLVEQQTELQDWLDAGFKRAGIPPLSRKQLITIKELAPDLKALKDLQEEIDLEKALPGYSEKFLKEKKAALKKLQSKVDSALKDMGVSQEDISTLSVKSIDKIVEKIDELKKTTTRVDTYTKRITGIYDLTEEELFRQSGIVRNPKDESKYGSSTKRG